MSSFSGGIGVPMVLNKPPSMSAWRDARALVTYASDTGIAASATGLKLKKEPREEADRQRGGAGLLDRLLETAEVHVSLPGGLASRRSAR